MMSLKTKIAVTAAIAAILLSGTTILVVAAAHPGASATAGVAVDSTKAKQLTQEGWQLWQQRKLAQAEARFSAATKLDPNLVDAWNGLGWSQFNQANNAGAQKAWERVIAMEPNHAAAQNGLGWIYFSQNDQAKAEAHWLMSAKTPEASASWSGLARIYLLQGKWDQARQWAGKLVDSGDVTAKQWLEAAQAEKVSDALKADIAPPPPPTAGSDDVVKGWQLLNQNRIADAVAVFQMAISKDAKNTNALNGLGWALMRTNKTSDAQAQFQKALDLNPNHGGAMNGLAIILKKQGKLDQAIEMWTKLDAMNPDATNGGTYALARTYLEGKQYDKALPYLQRLAKDLPDDTFVQKGLAEAKAHTGA